ncbi:MAG: helicase-associated domain-containing protein [Candidatus Thorarchaeota archaeon]
MAKEPLEKELGHILREDLMFACQYWDIDVSGSDSGTKLVSLLAEKMREKQTRDRVFATFSDREKDLLGMLSLSGGALSYDRLKPFRKIYSYGQLNQTERDLRKKGVIIRRMMSRVTDFGREVAEFKILDFLMPHLTKKFSKKPIPSNELPSKVRKITDDRDTLLVDMLLLLSYLKKHEVRMTSSWEFPKREADQIRAAMSEPKEERFELVQKMARKAGAYMIVEEDRVVPGKVEALFSGKQDEVSRRFLMSSLGRTRAIWATPDQPTEYTMNLAICRLRESNSEEWIPIEEMKDWIRSELFIDSQPLKWVQVDEDRVRLALETPLRLGLVEGAYRGKNLVAIKLTSVGERVLAEPEKNDAVSQETFFVLPNFEVTAFTSEMDYYKLYELMLFTEPVKTDIVSTYKISDKSVFEAIEIGIRESTMLEFLKNESSKPIPKNVVRSIKDWTSQTTFATVSDIFLFETESERNLEDLLLLEDFTKYVVRRVGPTAVIVTGDMEKLDEDLGEHKCNVRMTDKEEPPVEVSAGTAVAEQVLLYGDHGVTDVPEACLGCPATQSCNRVVRRKAKTKRSA